MYKTEEICDVYFIIYEYVCFFKMCQIDHIASYFCLHSKKVRDKVKLITYLSVTVIYLCSLSLLRSLNNSSP